MRRRQTDLALAALGIAAGVLLSLLAPLFFASIFWFALGSVFETWLSWPLCFAVAAAVALPLLFRLELRTGGEYLAQSINGSGMIRAQEVVPGAVMLSTYAGGSMGLVALARTANPRAASFALVEIFLSGPRLVVSGWRRWRTDRNFAEVDRERAAEVVTLLLERGGAVHPRQLLRPGELLHDGRCPPAALMQPLVWLAHHRWIGVSDSLEKVYLYSEAAAALRGECKRKSCGGTPP